MLPLYPLFSDIKKLLDQKKRIVLAIDGMSAAGKSSLADILAQRYSCSLIHMDHFFLRPHQRTPERFEMPGGNIDFERFISDVSIHLKSGKPFSYIPFDCKTQDFARPVLIEPKELTIVEGVYSMSPDIAKNSLYDISVFMRLDEELQHHRLKERNISLYKRFVNEWIPLENKYFEAFCIPDKCDHIIENMVADDENGEHQ